MEERARDHQSIYSEYPPTQNPESACCIAERGMEQASPLNIHSHTRDILSKRSAVAQVTDEVRE